MRSSIPCNRALMSPEFFKLAYKADDADLFACGVILFYLRTGSYPFWEATDKNSQYRHIMRGRYDQFWLWHERDKPQGFFSDSFKSLLNFMFASEPVTRITMADIVCHPWMREARGVE